jgi:hypothetical protein
VCHGCGLRTAAPSCPLVHTGCCGDLEKWGSFSSRHTPGCALEVQMSSIGANAEASSSDGNRIDVNCEFSSLCVKSGVPQSPQKLRVVILPLLARTEWVFGAPKISRSELVTTTPDANGAPLDRWQSPQWQFNMAMGVLAHRYWIDPQAHFPEKAKFMSTLSRECAQPDVCFRPEAAIPLRSPRSMAFGRTIALNVLHDGAQQPYGTTK